MNKDKRLSMMVLRLNGETVNDLHAYEAFVPPKIGHLFEIDGKHYEVFKVTKTGKNIYEQNIINISVFRTVLPKKQNT